MKVKKLLLNFEGFLGILIILIIIAGFIITTSQKSEIYELNSVIEKQKEENDILRGQIEDQSQEIHDLQSINDILQNDNIMFSSRNRELSEQHCKDQETIMFMAYESYKGSTFAEDINYFIDCLCLAYPRVDPYIVRAIVYHESKYDPTVVNPNSLCVGLTQLSTKWFSGRAEKLGLESMIEAHSNVLICVEYLNELLETNTIEEALYIYNHSTSYVNTILSTANKLRNGGE